MDMDMDMDMELYLTSSLFNYLHNLYILFFSKKKPPKKEAF